MKIRTKILFAVGGIIAFTCITFSCFIYCSKKNDLLNGVDEKLLTAAQNAHLTLPEGYHDSIIDFRSVSKEQYNSIVNTNNKLCSKLGLEYIWSLMVINDQIVFTSATSPSKDVAQGDHASFFELHTNPEAYTVALSTMEIQRSTVKDKWGKIRVVLVPHLDSKGRKILYGASMTTRDVQTLLSTTIIQSMLLASGVFLTGFLMMIALSRTFSRPVVELTNAAKKIADGNLDCKVDVGGSVELTSLSHSINDMARSTREKMDQLEESSGRFRAFLDSSPFAIIVVSNTKGEIEYINRKLVEMLGYQHAEIPTIDKWWPKVYPNKEYQKTVKKAWAAAVVEITSTGKELPSQEWVVRTKDGRDLDIRFQVAPIGDSSIVSLEDVTEQNRLKSQLIQAQKMEAIGTLAGGIAHDFNNMLGGIIGGAEMLNLYLPDDPKAKKYHEMIIKAANRAGSLTENLLTFARRSHESSTPVNIHDIIHETIALIKNTIDRRVNVKINLTTESSTIIGDPSQLQSAFLNLCINASQAMPDGGTISIESSMLELDTAYCSSSAFDLKAGWFLKVEVRDTGTGITPELLPNIFDPFFTTKTQGKGTGLGLATVYGIVKQHHGAIGVYSEPDQGTAFHILLPLDHTDAPVRKKTKTPLKGSGRILVVDDEEVMRVTAKAILEDLGYEVVLAEDGKQGLTVLKHDLKGFDLVLLDMIMPVMSGKDCFMAMTEYYPEIRIVLSSGFTREDDLKEMKHMGLNGFIRKPYHSVKLSQTVHDALSLSPDNT